MEPRVGSGVPRDGGARPVFISHVEENADVALAIAGGLEEAGYDTWCYERDALPGPSYLLQTARQIEESAAVVLLISPSSLGSHQVTAEVVRAHESGRPFIPVLIDISHAEFAARQPEWREALGSSTSVSLPAADVSAILPRILQGLAGLGILPIEGHEPRLTHPYVLPASPAFGPPARRRNLVLGLVAMVVAVALAGAFIAFAGSGGDGVEQARSPTSVPATSVTEPSTVPPPEASTTFPVPESTPTPSITSILSTPSIATNPAPPTTVPPPPLVTTGPASTTTPPLPQTTAPGVASADETSVATSAGTMDVLDASLLEEWCSFEGDCLTASGAQRYLVLVLVPAGGDAPNFDGTFTAQASQSSVTFGGGAAGTAKVFVDQEMEMAEVVYGMVPSSALSGDIVLHWPGNPALQLTVG